MSFNLQARFSLRDDFSSPMRRIHRQVERSNRMMERLRGSTNLAHESTGKLVSGMSKIGGASKGILSLQNTVLGVAGAFGAATAANKLFQSTIQEAAKMEQSSVMIEAMFDNKKASDQYQKMLQDMAVKSPIFDSQAMFANSKSFISLSKDNKELSKMWNLAERLAATDPIQGVEGSVLALKELFSGDAQSLVERFELDRKTLNNIKKMGLNDQLKELDKYFAKMGMTKSLIDKMGGTTLGTWQQIKESIAVSFREMGEPALRRIREFLIGTNNELQKGRLDGFVKFGARMIDKIAAGFISAAKGIGKWIDQIQNDPSFQEQTTLLGKVDWVLNDVYERFLEWYSSGGSKLLSKVSEDITSSLADALNSNIPRLVEVGIKIGAGIGSGIMKGIASRVTGNIHLEDKKVNPSDYLLKPDDFGHIPKKNGGINYVPRDGAIYSLHRGETILPRGQADEYRKNNGKVGGGNTYQFNVTMNGSGSAKQDAKQLFEFFVKEVEMAGANG